MCVLNIKTKYGYMDKQNFFRETCDFLGFEYKLAKVRNACAYNWEPEDTFQLLLINLHVPPFFLPMCYLLYLSQESWRRQEELTERRWTCYNPTLYIWKWAQDAEEKDLLCDTGASAGVCGGGYWAGTCRNTALRWFGQDSCLCAPGLSAWLD